MSRFTLARHYLCVARRNGVRPSRSSLLALMACWEINGTYANLPDWRDIWDAVLRLRILDGE